MERKLLRNLVRVRLIRRIANLEEISYELTHEYLIHKIRDWIDLEVLRVKEAQDLLRRAHNNWERHRISMSRSALVIVNAQREHMRLNNLQTAFLLSAAVEHDVDFEYWLARNR